MQVGDESQVFIYGNGNVKIVMRAYGSERPALIHEILHVLKLVYSLLSVPALANKASLSTFDLHLELFVLIPAVLIAPD